MTVAVLSAAADAWVDQAQPTSSFGNTGFLAVGELYFDSPNPHTEGIARSWMRFDLSSIPAHSVINSAALSFYVGFSVDGYGIEVYEIHRSTDLSWGETAITWNNQPAITGTPATFEVSSDGGGSVPGTGVHSVNVKTLVEAALADGGISFRFKNREENEKGIWLSDREYSGAYHPTLTIDYTVPRRRANLVWIEGA